MFLSYKHLFYEALNASIQNGRILILSKVSHRLLNVLIEKRSRYVIIESELFMLSSIVQASMHSKVLSKSKRKAHFWIKINPFLVIASVAEAFESDFVVVKSRQMINAQNFLKNGIPNASNIFFFKLHDCWLSFELNNECLVS